DELHIHPSDYDPIYEDETTLNFQKDIQNKLKDIPCKKIFLIDACHSGAANSNTVHDSGTKGVEFSEDLANALIKLSEASNDFYYLLSSSAGEVSYTDESWGNSAFTKGILEAFRNQTENTLQGIQQADADHNKIIDLKELFDYIKERVPVIIQSKKDLRSSQTPYTPNLKALKDLSIFVLGS
ncbi:MAG: caspase family protein, partial [Saprospiraceae bacterium]